MSRICGNIAFKDAALKNVVNFTVQFYFLFEYLGTYMLVSV